MKDRNAKAPEVFYRGSVKDLAGPIKVADRAGAPCRAVLFQYTDAFSVFDWGRMPDTLPGKGAALAVVAAHFFEAMEKPETWREFSKTPEALALRKASRFGAAFNERGEELQKQGLRTHYLGVIANDEVADLTQARRAPQTVVVRQVTAVKPEVATVLGRQVSDYTLTRQSPAPRLVPLEVVFRFSAPEGSSLFERVEQNPQYLSSIGWSGVELTPQSRFDFPLLEVFTKLEASDRVLSLSEGLAVSGITAHQFQSVLLDTAWVAAYLRASFARHGLELADGKLEWAINEQGQVMLVDAIGPDELRVLKDGVQLSKEFLRQHYRQTDWYAAVKKAKTQAHDSGQLDWKRAVQVPVPNLPSQLRELAAQVYLSLANQLTGKKWFPEAWDLPKVIDELRNVKP